MQQLGIAVSSHAMRLGAWPAGSWPSAASVCTPRCLPACAASPQRRAPFPPLPAATPASPSPAAADCKDKFLVQCVKLGPGEDAKEVTPEMFDATKAKDIRQALHSSNSGCFAWQQEQQQQQRCSGCGQLQQQAAVAPAGCCIQLCWLHQ